MEHHDLAHRRWRTWPLDQTSLKHPNPYCTNMAQEHSQPTDRIKTAVNHSNCSSYSLFCFITSTNNVVVEHKVYIFIHFYNQGTILQGDDAECTALLRSNTLSPLSCTKPLCSSSSHLSLDTPLGICFHTTACSKICKSRIWLDRNVLESASQLASLLVC